LITSDTFWEPVIGSKPVNRLTGYRFTSLFSIYRQSDSELQN